MKVIQSERDVSITRTSVNRVYRAMMEHIINSLTLMIYQFCITLRYTHDAVRTPLSRVPRGILDRRSARDVYRHDETRYHLYACQ